jgi:hypothetical protein
MSRKPDRFRMTRELDWRLRYPHEPGRSRKPERNRQDTKGKGEMAK